MSSNITKKRNTLENTLNCRIHFGRLTESFALTSHRRNFSGSENQKSASPDEPTETEKKLQAEVDNLAGQVAQLTEKSDELLVCI